MAKTTDLSLAVLKAIRDEIKKTNSGLDQLRKEMSGRIDALREGVTELREETNTRFDELGRRIVESELRTATALTDLAGTIRDMTTLLKSQADLRPRLDKCEQEIAEIKRRLAS